MKHVITILSLLFIWSAPVFSQSQATNKSADQAVLQMNRAFQKAVTAGDRTTVAGMLADDYVAVFANGAVRNKQEMISRLSPASSEVLDSAMDVRVYGNTAVANTLYLFREREHPQVQQYVRRMTVWVKQDNTWKLAASHATRVPVWNVRPLEDGEMESLTSLVCGEEQTLKSQHSEMPTYIRFRNNSAGEVYAYRIDYSGKRVQREPYTIPIKPGSVYESNTFVTHPFVVVDAAGKCLGIYQPSVRPSLVVIK